METTNIFNYNQYKLTISQLEYDHLDKLQDIFHEKVVNKKQDKKNITQLTKVYNEKRQPQELEDLFIRDLAIYHLSNAGLEVNPNYFMIEFWRHRCFGDKFDSSLRRHKDSYGVMNCPIITCIFYIRKDAHLMGGNLNIFGYAPIGSLLFTPKEIVESISNKVVCMDGSIIHSITPFQGFGIRDAIVVQFEKAHILKPLLPFIKSIKVKVYTLDKNDKSVK
jgi:hypothetical protein